jgi:predicted nucleic acid-binding protein
MSENRVFIDTNVFVYAKLKPVKNDGKHREAVRLLKEIDVDVIISIQVVNEFSSSLLKHKIDDKVIRSAIHELADGCTICPVFFKTTENAWEIRERYGFSYWDSLIISSALENQCDKLFTEDLQHEQVIEDRLTIINPFVSVQEE